MDEQPHTVLILDDDEVVRESLVDFFEDRGWRVLPTATAEDAVEVLAHETPDGALVDIRLPGMDGNAFMHAACAAHPNLACVICTGSPEYQPPGEVASLPQVSRRVFAKPLHDLAALEAELRQQMETCRRKEDNDE